MCPKTQTPAQQKTYWDALPNASDFTGTPDYGMGGWACPLDETSTPPTASRHETCGDNSGAAPGGKIGENPFAKVLSAKCWARVWQKLLELPVSSRAFPGTCTPLHKARAVILIWEGGRFLGRPAAPSAPPGGRSPRDGWGTSS